MRERRSERLLARMRWPMRGSANDASAGPGSDGPAAGNDARHGGLDWQQAQTQLGPVRHRWDLAILCNLDADTRCRLADILAGISLRGLGTHLRLLAPARNPTPGRPRRHPRERRNILHGRRLRRP